MERREFITLISCAGFQTFVRGRVELVLMLADACVKAIGVRPPMWTRS